MRLSYLFKDRIGIGGYGKLFEYSSEQQYSSFPEGRVFAAKVATVGNDGVDDTAELDVALKKARVTNHVRHPLLLHEAWALIQLRGKPNFALVDPAHMRLFMDLTEGHPNIPRAFGWGRSQYFEYLVMERLGSDLEGTVKEVGLTQRNTVALICQMVRSFHH